MKKFKKRLIHLCLSVTIFVTISVSCESFIQIKLNYDVSAKYTYAGLGDGEGCRLEAGIQL